jgi:hypothetical protein
MERKVFRSRIGILLLILLVLASNAAVFFVAYLAYKEPTVTFDSNAFKMSGIYGAYIPFAGICETDTIAWREMPAISIRTNGISFSKVHRGRFRTTDGKKIRLSVCGGVSPVLRITGKDSLVYYINRENAAETRQIFKKLQENIKTAQQ